GPAGASGDLEARAVGRRVPLRLDDPDCRPLTARPRAPRAPRRHRLRALPAQRLASHQVAPVTADRVGPDSPCLHASPGWFRSYKWANGLNYQGTTFGCD